MRDIIASHLQRRRRRQSPTAARQCPLPGGSSAARNHVLAPAKEVGEEAACLSPEGGSGSGKRRHERPLRPHPQRPRLRLRGLVHTHRGWARGVARASSSLSAARSDQRIRRRRGVGSDSGGRWPPKEAHAIAAAIAANVRREAPPSIFAATATPFGVKRLRRRRGHHPRLAPERACMGRRTAEGRSAWQSFEKDAF